MAKQITQQTFDDVVRENMTEFDMEVQEAIDDAVQQFESQGVNLALIVKDASLYTEGNSEHPLITSIKNLNLLSQKEISEKGEIIEFLHKIRTECDIDLSRRCLAGNNEGYRTLIKLLEKYKSDFDLIKEILLTLVSLTNGQPDIMDMIGVSLCMEILKSYEDQTDVLELTFNFIRNTCVKHESNKQDFVNQDLISEASMLLNKHKHCVNIIKEICSTLRVLTYDDDLRVPFGKAHDRAKMIVTEGNALKTILDICKEFPDKPAVLCELFSTIGKLVVRDEFCKAVMDMGGLEFIFKAFQESIDDKGIVRQALDVIQRLSGNDQVKVAVVKAGGIELILLAMTKHQANSQVSELGCAAITTIILRNPDHCTKVMQNGGHQAIVQAMKIHKNEENVQKQACMALRNLVARTRDYCEPILELGAETLINDALKKYKSCHDEAKAALRDLGCHVELRELWKGETAGITE
ncbi:hypothetical protein KUTeg_018564 [Tegillarca granosa]|uniref:LRRK2 ARM repeat domain-containing protein n=1 Tax=Tegillarca granosa TaxID=220873 RepID=A0ABQ9EKS0_TEGGR|nr:hypothetical protein KUTeg_018564 [Tegillarca granosa]